MKTKNSIILIAGLLVMFLITNCKKQESPEPRDINGIPNNPTIPPNPYTPPAVTFSAPVMGFVVDENGNAVQNAIVSTGDQTFTTDANGAFEFTSAPFTGDFCYIKAVKNGYFTSSTTVHGTSDSKFSIQMVMMAQNNIQSFSAVQGKTVSVGSNASVDFPAGSIKTLDGKPYTGNVKVAVAHINPSASNFSELIPGGDLRGYDSEGKNVQLVSYGMLNVELRDDAGNYLQLADGQKATLSMDVPANMLANASNTIPLWYFDENKGVWIEEGEAKLQNGKYVGTVTHFTAWNCDWRGPRATVKGKIRDCDGDAVLDYKVMTDNQSAEVNQNGEWKRWVPSGMEISIDAYIPSENIQVALGEKTPKLTEGQTFDVGMLTVPCRQKVKGTITDCDNQPFSGYAIIKTATKTFRGTITNGKLSVTVFTNGEPAELFIHNASVGQLYKVNITLPASGKSLDLGAIKACPPKTITPKFSFDYDDGSGVQSVSFDNISNGRAVYYTWSKNMGFLFENQGASIKSARFGIYQPKLGPQTGVNDSVEISLSTDKKTFYGTSISYNLQKLETAGGEITGTFSGTMMMFDYSGTPINKSVTITNGKFTVLRLPDE